MSSTPTNQRAAIITVISTVGLALAILVLGIYLGGHSSHLPGFVRNSIVGDRHEQVVQDAFDRIERTYYRKIPGDQLADAAIGGMVTSLRDRFSNYFSAKQYRAFQADEAHSFSGIGVTISNQRNKRGVLIGGVLPQSPAAAAGIKTGDVIVNAAGHSLRGRSEQYSATLIRGQAGTKVTIVVARGKHERTLTLTRKTIVTPIVTSSLHTVHGKKIAVVSLAAFDPGAHGELAAALQRRLRQGAKGIVFDLRDNGGGLVTEARLVASLFLRNGTIVTTRGRDVQTETLTATGDPIAANQPLAVLVNGNTASASEIVTGALQDRHRATVVGTNTFGKGVFQEVINLTNGGALDITAGEYFTPSGRNLGGGGVRTGAGITPNVRVSPKAPPSVALNKALQVVAAKVK